MGASSWDEYADDLEDREYPDPDEADNEPDSETIACQECGAELYEDADVCPACGAFILHDTRPWSGRPWWWIGLALLGVAALIAALTVGL